MTNIIKTFTINLDLEPKNRYSEIVSSFDINKISYMLNQIYDQYTNSIPFVESLVKLNINKAIYSDEIQFWADTFNLPFYKVLVMQLLYEINSGCTTFVIPGNIMFRTMDWPLEFLKEITYQAVFIKNNVKIYEAVCWVGSIGIFTGKSLTNNYAVAINYRRVNDTNIKSIFNNYLRTINMCYPVSYLLRHVLETNTKYNTMIEILKNTKLISPVYYIVCKFNNQNKTTKQPLIIQRDVESYEIISDLKIIQTNSDKNNGISNIMYSKERAEIVRQAIEKYESIDDILINIYKYPVISHETIYLSIISKDMFITNKI